MSNIKGWIESELKPPKKMAVKSPQQVESEMVYLLGQAHKRGYVKVRPTHSAINILSFANGGNLRNGSGQGFAKANMPLISVNP
jgi:hypothetical protein